MTPRVFFTNRSEKEFDTYFPDVDSPKLVRDLQLHRKPVPVFAKGSVTHLITSLEKIYEAEHPGTLQENDKLKFCYVGDRIFITTLFLVATLTWKI